MTGRIIARMNGRRLVSLWLFVTLAGVAAQANIAPFEPLSSFPKSAVTIHSKSGARSFEVWVADSNPRRGQGLMYVKRLDPGTGMLFLYGQPQAITMWMKNTLVPLDMLFVAADGRITKPHSLDRISSLGLVTAVIEIGGGESVRLGIEPGDRVVHPAFARNAQ
jgi:uncharacterized protein